MSAAVIKTPEAGELRFELDERLWTKQDATKKAVMALLACWAMAGLTVFIPIVHFVSVPGFLLIGPVLAFVLYRSFNGKRDLRTRDATCPKCKQPLEISGPESVWPQTGRCDQCGTSFTAELT